MNGKGTYMGGSNLDCTVLSSVKRESERARAVAKLSKRSMMSLWVLLSWESSLSTLPTRAAYEDDNIVGEGSEFGIEVEGGLVRTY